MAEDNPKPALSCSEEFNSLMRTLYMLQTYQKPQQPNQSLKVLEASYFQCLKKNNIENPVKEMQYYRFLYDQLLKNMTLAEKINWICQK